MSQGKKLTQTTLPFLIKPKLGNASPNVLNSSTKKRPGSVQDFKEDLPKKPKAEGEPEVSSSSEQVDAVINSPVATEEQSALGPYLVLKRCETPKIEVSSSTSSDEIPNIGGGLLDSVDSSVCEIVENDLEISAEEKVAQPEDKSVIVVNLAGASSPKSEYSCDNNTTFDTSISLSQDANSSTLLTSPDYSLLTKTPKSVTKNLSVSAQKKQEQHKAIIEQKRKQREEDKEKRLQQKQEEKLKKEKEIEEKKRIKAEQKEAERLAKLKEKEEQQKQKDTLKAEKQAEIDAKNALKDAEKRRKEEEKQQKELERTRVEEEKKRKNEAQKNALFKFFQKPSKTESPEPIEDTVKACSGKFKPFSVKSDMRLAPLVRVPPINKSAFDLAFHSQELEKGTYFCELKTNGLRTNPSTWPWTDDDDVEILPAIKRHRVKFLQFHTDVRPAYFGTWRKKSRCIRPCRPLAQDKERFDYEVDSADEWEEEEEPGESVDSGEEDEEEKDEFDFDPELREDGFLVDHNYLSDDEGGLSDNDESLAAKKTKQIIARTYGKRNRKKPKLKPIVYGTVWEGQPLSEQQERSRLILQHYTAIVFQSVPIEFSAPPKKDSPASVLATPVPDEALPEFIQTIHGCMKNSGFIIKQFQSLWKEKTSVILPKRQLKMTIRSIASYQKKPIYRRSCWYVHDEVLTKHGLTDLPVPHLMHLTSPDKCEKRTSASKLTPLEVKSSPAPNSAQKRLMDFIQPAKKKLKLAEGSVEVDSKQAKDVTVITLGDSPSTSKPKDAAASSATNTKTLVKSPNHESITPLTTTTVATPSSKASHNNTVSRRVGLTMLQAKPVHSGASTTINSVSPRGPDDLVKVNSKKQAKNVTVITLEDSPSTAKPKDAAASSATNTKTLVKSPNHESITPLATTTVATPSSKASHNNTVPRRVGLTMLQAKPVHSGASTIINSVSPRGAEDSVKVNSKKQAKNVTVITLEDSPSTSKPKDAAASSATNTKTLMKSPNHESITPLTTTTPLSKASHNSTVPRRVGLTMLQAKHVHSGASTIINSVSPRGPDSSGPVSSAHSPRTSTVSASNAQSPRRVALTTLSTPPKAKLAQTKPEVSVSPHTSKSPRRVQLITLGQPASTVAPPTTNNMLTERSQNTQKVYSHDKPVKNTI